MAEQNTPKKQKQKGRKLIPALCNIIGCVMLLAVIVTCIPVTVPSLMGYEIYNIVSGSMEPAIPVGSVIYVKSVEPETVQEDDVIAFYSEGSVVAHRVMKNQTVEGEFVTKGDANEKEDMHTVPYEALIGRVQKHYPYLGRMMGLYTSTIGKVYVIAFAACGAMFNMLAGRLRRQ